MDTQLSQSLRDGMFELRLGETMHSVNAELSTVSDIYEGAGGAGSRLRSDDPVLTLLVSQLNGERDFQHITVELNQQSYGVADYSLNDGWLRLLLARQRQPSMNTRSTSTDAHSNRRVM